MCETYSISKAPSSAAASRSAAPCTIHLNGEPTRACVDAGVGRWARKDHHLEGLSADASHPVQQAWLANDVPQCGLRQAGQIMSAAALLARKADPSERTSTGRLAGNLCRCGPTCAIRKAIHDAADATHTTPAGAGAPATRPVGSQK